ncbi:hypothetical protein [Sphingomonas sp.]|uniref:hypothetical protein n=1 Tax=Sphingomonas sp. TaxID=28214 RepID=UPI003CC601D3
MTEVAGSGDSDRTSLYLPMPGNPQTVDIVVDREVVRSVHAHKLMVHGEIGPLLVAVDRYLSRDMADGEEVYVRLLDQTAGEERWHLHAGSAMLGLQAEEPLLDWSADRQSVVVRLLGRSSLRLSLDQAGVLCVEPADVAPAC